MVITNINISTVKTIIEPTFLVSTPQRRVAGISLVLKPILLNHILIPPGAVFEIALLCFVVHPDDAKALTVSKSPFEVIQ